jgi:two-component system, cell cycle response regulator DivK
MNRSIVVVDEHPSVVSAFVTALTQDGFAPSGAHAFRDAVRLLLAVEPAMLVVSVELGAYNGLHLLLRSSADFPSMKAIVIGPANPAVEDEARALGASAYLSRPVTPSALVEQVQALLLTTACPPQAMIPLEVTTHA